MAIKIGHPFERTSSAPVDKDFVLSKAEMRTKDDNRMPDNYFAVCSDDGKFYIYNKLNSPSADTGKFTPMDGGGGNVVRLLLRTPSGATVKNTTNSNFFMSEYNAADMALYVLGATGATEETVSPEDIVNNYCYGPNVNGKPEKEYEIYVPVYRSWNTSEADDSYRNDPYNRGSYVRLKVSQQIYSPNIYSSGGKQVRFVGASATSDFWVQGEIYEVRCTAAADDGTPARVTLARKYIHQVDTAVNIVSESTVEGWFTDRYYITNGIFCDARNTGEGITSGNVQSRLRMVQSVLGNDYDGVGLFFKGTDELIAEAALPSALGYGTDFATDRNFSAPVTEISDETLRLRKTDGSFVKPGDIGYKWLMMFYSDRWYTQNHAAYAGVVPASFGGNPNDLQGRFENITMYGQNYPEVLMGSAMVLLLRK